MQAAFSIAIHAMDIMASGPAGNRARKDICALHQAALKKPGEPKFGLTALKARS